MSHEERFAFIVEWFDTAASLIRTYQLTYFTLDKAIELVTTTIISPKLIMNITVVRSQEQENLLEEM